jgi:hypothetical protein
MKTNCRSLAALVAVLLACANVAHAQESRAEALQQEREGPRHDVEPDAHIRSVRGNRALQANGPRLGNRGTAENGQGS